MGAEAEQSRAERTQGAQRSVRCDSGDAAVSALPARKRDRSAPLFVPSTLHPCARCVKTDMQADARRGSRDLRADEGSDREAGAETSRAERSTRRRVVRVRQESSAGEKDD